MEKGTTRVATNNEDALDQNANHNIATYIHEKKGKEARITRTIILWLKPSRSGKPAQ